MKTIDLSHEIKNGMMVFPGDPEISIEEGLSHEEDYCHVDRMHINSHTGTHIDAPYHFIKDGKRITDYEVGKFVGEGIAIDLTYKKSGEGINVSDLEKANIEEGMIVTLVTGWAKYFGQEKYLDHPFITKEAAEFLVKKGTSIVAVDFLNVYPTVYESWEAHPVLLSNDVLIVENIANSSELAEGKKYIFSFLPLKLWGSDGSPVRGMAVEK